MFVYINKQQYENMCIHMWLSCLHCLNLDTCAPISHKTMHRLRQHISPFVCCVCV